MAAPKNLLIVSDVHLCRLRPRMFEGGQRHFAAFVRRMTREPARDGLPWRLIINGDLLDFDHQARSISERGPEAASLALFDEMASEHGEAFDALAAFLDAGHDVVFIPGNHDLDLMWPSVRARFGERLSATGSGRLHHHDWFYYEPGRIYVEHGQQYDPDTATLGLLSPFDTDSGERELRRNLGTWWVAEFCPHITELAYHVDHTRSALYYIPTVIRKLAWRAPVLWARYLGFLRRALMDAGGPRAHLPEGHDDRRSALIERAGVTHVQLQAIERASATPRLASRIQTAGRLHAVPASMVPVVLGLGAGAAVTASAPLGIAAAGLLGAVALFNALVSTRFHGRVPQLLRVAAPKVQRAMNVPFVSFGHVHQETDEPAGEGRYLNSGTWADPHRPMSYLRFEGLDGRLCAFVP